MTGLALSEYLFSLRSLFMMLVICKSITFAITVVVFKGITLGLVVLLEFSWPLLH